MKKLKDTFDDRPTRPSGPPVTTRAGALVVRFEHWTPKGDCKVTGNKERKKKLPKKSSPKIEIIFNFI